MCIVYVCAYVNPPQWDPPQWPLSVALVKRNEKRETPLSLVPSRWNTYVREFVLPLCFSIRTFLYFLQFSYFSCLSVFRYYDISAKHDKTLISTIIHASLCTCSLYYFLTFAFLTGDIDLISSSSFFL